MKQYLLSIYQPDGDPPPPEVLEPIMRDISAVDEDMRAAGAWVFNAGLHPPETATVVRAAEGDVLVTDGPFAETKELVAGFWVWKVSSLQEAIDWVKKCPNPMMEDSDIEVRPFLEPEDLAAVIDPAVPEGETRLKVRARMMNWTP